MCSIFLNKEKFTLEDIEKLHNDKPEFFKPNMKHKRNEALKIIKGQKLYKKQTNYSWWHFIVIKKSGSFSS